MNKTCLKCNSVKPMDSFRPVGANSDGRASYCRECAKVHPMSELLSLGTKVCTCCKVEKQRTEFNVRLKAGKHEIRSKCEECLQMERKLKYNSNPELYREKSRLEAARQRANNPEKVTERSRRQRETNQFKGKTWKEYMAEYRNNNKDVLAPKQKVRSKKHLERIKNGLEDSYILSRLAQNTGIPAKELKEMDGVGEMIEVKRQIIKVHRAKTEVQKKQR